MKNKSKKFGPPLNNQNAVKLRTLELKKEAYESFCEWISKGKSYKSFTFQKGDLKVTGFTVKKYIDEDPLVFEPIHREFAWSQGYAVWEQIAEDSAIGKNKHANTASLQMVMRNKFDWDKADTQTENHKGHVLDLVKGLRDEPVSETEAGDQDIEQ